MKSLTLVTLLSLASSALAASAPNICYDSKGTATQAKYDQFMTYDVCRPACSALGKNIMALHNGGECYCADSLPPSSDKVDSSQCNVVCNGFGSDYCGGLTTYTFVAVQGDINMIANSQGSSSGSSSNPSSNTNQNKPSQSVSSSSKPSLVSSVVVLTSGTAAVTQVIVQTVYNNQPDSTAQPQQTNNSSGGGGGGISTGAIAAAVVVSVVGGAALIAAIIFFLKWKKERDDMSSHRRIQSNSAFGNAPSISDSRLDHTMVERRTSNGSIFADNEDYSRKILRVANPDDR